MKPLNDRILVLRVEEEQKSPDTAKEKPMEGKIVAAGPGKRGDDGSRCPLEIKKGDRVLFSKYAGTEITMDGKEHLFRGEGVFSLPLDYGVELAYSASSFKP